MHLLSLALAGILVGVLSGLLGIGGGIVLVPLLIVAFAMAQKRAQATSLAAITLTALAGAITYAVAGNVILLPAIAIVVGGLVGAAVGAEIVHRLPERALTVIFAALMVLIAARMALAPAVQGAGEIVHLDPLVIAGYVGSGLLMGVFSALVGVGGGIVIVPLLILAFGFTPHEAQGTSLAVMVPISLMGAWRHARRGYTDWRSGLVLGIGGVVGAPLGAVLALALAGPWLQRIFAVVLVLSALQLLRRALRSR